MDIFKGEDSSSDYQVIHPAEIYQLFSLALHYSSSMLAHTPLPIMIRRTSFSIHVSSY